MKPILEFALEIATEAHKGQKRKDGQGYITHPIAVYEILKKSYPAESVNFLEQMTIIDEKTYAKHDCLMLIAALWHDIAEDTSICEESLVDKLVDDRYIHKYSYTSVNLQTILKTLNKNYYGSYLEYILEVSAINGAREVKLADLQHNLSDLKPGSLRDKYMMAKYMLENHHKLPPL